MGCVCCISASLEYDVQIPMTTKGGEVIYQLSELDARTTKLSSIQPGEFSNAATKQQVIDILAKGFAGTTKVAPDGSNSWCIDPQASGPNPCDPLLAEPDEARKKVAQWSCDYIVHTAARHGGVFYMKDAKTNQVQAAMVTFPPNSQHLHDDSKNICNSLYAMRQSGFPPDFPPGCSNRYELLQKKMKEFHALMEDKLHWYVLLIAVNPDAQGQGFGSKLMSFVSQLGDATNTPVYLETAGEKLERFYEKFGFKVIQRGELRQDENTVFDQFCAMAREPGQESQA